MADLSCGTAHRSLEQPAVYESTPLKEGSSSNAETTAEEQQARASTVLGELISALPLSPCHYNLFGAVALVFVADGALHAIFPWVIANAKQDYELEPLGESALVSRIVQRRLSVHYMHWPTRVGGGRGR